MARLHHINGVNIPFTKEEEDAADIASKQWEDGGFDRGIVNLREKRTQLLAETDWVVIRARENGGQVPAAWKTYRVALRDLPSGLDTVEKVNAVTWPTKPS